MITNRDISIEGYTYTLMIRVCVCTSVCLCKWEQLIFNSHLKQLKNVSISVMYTHTCRGFYPTHRPIII